MATTLLREMDMGHWLIQAEEALAALSTTEDTCRRPRRPLE